jgi:peptidoglycan/LPS O-acetylase OafA/YrhL
MRVFAVNVSRHTGQRPERFRTDIQGMRAIAVLAVALGHAGIPGFSGGFVGVDVFFVISGFLISRLLLDELSATATLDLVGFWIKRARRLLPNALITLLATILLTAFIFPGYNLLLLAREITRTCLELSNFYFAGRAVDYFHFDDAPSPVMQFWSLSVEEQFYLLWPLLLLGLTYVSRGKVLKTAGWVLCAIWAISLGASILLTPVHQPLAYFGTGTRCWQLATGALLALHWQTLVLISPALRSALAVMGLAAVAFSVFTFTSVTPYPGAWALMPTLGAAAIILGGERTGGWVPRLLSVQPMHWLGERSYSWYLWHWPLIVLPKAAYPDSEYIPVVALLVSLGIASLAYSYVEDPIRRNRLLVGTPIVSAVAAAAAVIVVIGAGWSSQLVVIFESEGIARRRALIEAAYKDRPNIYEAKCHLRGESSEQPECLYGNQTAERRVVLFGDSHAAQWFEPLSAAASVAGWRLNTWTKSACPVADILVLSGDGRPNQACKTWRENVMKSLTGSDRPDLVIIASRSNQARLADPRTGSILSDAEAETAWREGYRKILRQLVQAEVTTVFIRDTPTFKIFPICFVQGRSCERRKTEALRGARLEQEVTKTFGDHITVADFNNYLCGDVTCSPIKGNEVIFRDRHHLTASFTRTLTPHFADLLRKVTLSEGKQPQPVAAHSSAWLPPQ